MSYQSTCEKENAKEVGACEHGISVVDTARGRRLRFYRWLSPPAFRTPGSCAKIGTLPMPRLLVFQHVAHEVLGTLDPLLRDARFRIRYTNFGRHPTAEPTLDGYDGLIVLGGPMNVDQEAAFPHLRTELRVIEDALKREIPMLGICLGGQLLAKALGAEVRKNHVREIGWYELRRTTHGVNDPMVRHFSDREPMFQWHGDTFAIPNSALHLAESDDCPNQAFRYGDKAYGLQFHMEVDEPMIHRWLHVPSLKEELDSMGEANSAERIRAHTTEHIGRLKGLSRSAFGEFVSLVGQVRRIVRLPSR